MAIESRLVQQRTYRVKETALETRAILITGLPRVSINKGYRNHRLATCFNKTLTLVEIELSASLSL
jgi:hypothetical protein